ncbi:MAG: ABC transporter ATP-binding protein/permease [Candidatus Nomurabacteria bacterium]|jgi:ATP-binding cassette subfamily B protein|nr:ABC transporter ATP-binding protein/permease [Candidatus Nomurabacteria bacterium]
MRLKNLWRVVSAHKWLLLVVVLLALVSTIFAIVGPKLLGNITTEVANALIKAVTAQSPISINFSAIAKIATFLLTLYIISVAAEIASGILMAKIAQKLTLTLRRQIVQKINRLPIAYFDRHKFGDTLARITNDVDTILGNLAQAFTQIISSIMMLGGILVMMFTISWQLSLIALATVPVATIFIGFVSKKSQKYFKATQNHLAEITAEAEEVYAGHTVVKAFAAEDLMTQKFTAENHRLQQNTFKSQFISGLLFPITHLIGNFGYVFVAAIGAGLAIDGKINIGDIQAFIQYINQFNRPLAQIGQTITLLQSTAAASERVFDFLDEPDEPTHRATAKLPKNIRGEIICQNLVFQYADSDTPAIKNLSFTTHAGQKVAIVGPTGAGKTTLVNLLMRFYDLQSGQILLDGTDIATVPRAEVRARFGMVLQQTWLIDDTLRENLRYGKPHATDAEIMTVAKAAGIEHLINDLPQGLDTPIGEEHEILSSGEKQLITIARAMLADAPMLILDEATSNVDTRTEQTIASAMQNLTKNRTSFIIAHRLSTIRGADLILVVNNGDIVEQGTHQQLLKLNGFYADLYNSQYQSAPTE